MTLAGGCHCRAIRYTLESPAGSDALGTRPNYEFVGLYFLV